MMLRFLSGVILAILTLIPLRGETLQLGLQGVVRDTAVTVKTDSRDAEKLLLKLRGATRSEKTVVTVTLSGDDHSVDVTLSTSVDNKFSTYGAEKAEVEICRDEEKVSQTDVRSNFNVTKGEYNTIVVSVKEGGRLAVSGGSRVSKQIAGIDSLDFDIENVAVSIKGEMDMAEATVETWPSASSSLMTGWTMETIAERLSKSNDPIEGYWRYLDRENDRRYARPGGEYHLAVLRGDAGTYDIIYVAGAETNRSLWMPGMLKGRLRATAFADHYDLEWYDAEMEPQGREAYATLTPPAILTFYFPLLKSQLRFTK
ncbi:MAG: hypothetical protein NC098_03675 [Lachnoclostridium sp.]|nr:hypothetical protein [Lachnoclostridium sp.]